MHSRREFLQKSAMGFGTLALSGVMEQELRGSSMPLYPKVPHFAPPRQTCHLPLHGRRRVSGR